MDDTKFYMNINKDNIGGDEDSNLLTQDEHKDVDYFVAITIKPLTRYQYIMLRNIHMEI